MIFIVVVFFFFNYKIQLQNIPDLSINLFIIKYKRANNYFIKQITFYYFIFGIILRETNKKAIK
jgi:hypothetical protein